MAYSPEDLDYLVRTVYGEAANQGPVGQQAVAAVIRNRAMQGKQSFRDVVLAKNQFEPWGSRANELRGLDPNSPKYQRILQAVRPVVDGELPDPTNGATHFYAPKAQAALGRKAPSWDNGTGVDLGDHRFFKLGYNPGQGNGNRHGIPNQGNEQRGRPMPSPMEQAMGAGGQDTLAGGPGADTVTTPPPEMSTLDKFLTGGPGALFGQPQEGWNMGDALTGAGVAMMARDNPSGAAAMAAALRYKKDGTTKGANRQVIRTDAKSGQATIYNPETGEFKTQQVFDRAPEEPKDGTRKLFEGNYDAASKLSEGVDIFDRHRRRVANGEVDLTILDRVQQSASELMGTPMTPAQRNAVELALDLENMRNNKLLEHKGVQTEGDAERAMKSIMPGMGKYNPDAVLTALDKGYSATQRMYDRAVKMNEPLWKKYGDRIGFEGYDTWAGSNYEKWKKSEEEFTGQRENYYKKRGSQAATTEQTITGRPPKEQPPAAAPAAREEPKGEPIYREGQTATGPSGQKLIFRSGRWHKVN